MHTSPIQRKYILLIIALLVAFSMATPVLADFLGPNRTVTTTVSVCQAVLFECKKVKDHYKYKRMEDWSCPSGGDACEGYSKSKGECDDDHPSGSAYCSKVQKTETIITTNPPATIAGSIQNCTLQNGWCVTPPELSLNASEPLSGYSILLIEGSRNGETFACSESEVSCKVSLNEGDNNFNYWALSSWGDSSDMGTLSSRVDTVSPDLGLDIAGAGGANGWYVSPTTVTATGWDATSGVASRLLSVNSGALQPSALLNEGVHILDIEVTDNAGNRTQDSTTISVDTTTPTIDISVNGTLGNNGWYISDIQVSALPSDVTSGIWMFEVSPDGSAYQTYNAPVPFSDGHHTIQFKATDIAGNVTETPLQDFFVDTIAPTVDLPASWELGNNIFYEVVDDGSGLAALRFVIEDEDERYAKVTWNKTPSGSNIEGQIDWDGVFKDKTVAPPGTYLAWIKARDQAGNEHFQLGKVIVPEPEWLVNFLPPEEAASEAPLPPGELFDAEEVPETTSNPAPGTSTGLGTGFVGTTTETTTVVTQSLLLTSGKGGAAPSSSTSSTVLWGAAAASVIGAATTYALDVTRKRKEAEEAQAAAVRAQVAHDKEKRAENHMTEEEKVERAKEHEEKVKERKEQEEWANLSREEKEVLKQQEERDLAYQQKLYQQWLANQQAATPPQPPPGISPEAVAAYYHGGEDARKWINNNVQALREDYVKQQVIDAEIARKKAEEKKKAAEAARAAEELQTNLAGYYNAEKQGEPTVFAPAKAKSWWDKTLDWVDDHQTELAIGIGVAVGVGAIILSGGVAAPLVAAAWATGAALVAGGAVAAVTIGLNAHYDRPWNKNFIRNVMVAGLAAGVVTGAWFMFQALTTAVGGYCAVNQATCMRMETVFKAWDTVEELCLQGKLTYQSWTWDEAGARETTFELQTEYVDGSMPGNSVADELREQLSTLNEDTLHLVETYGDHVISLLVRYGDSDEVIDIIGAYGDEGIAILKKYGDEAIRLVEDHGTSAIKLMKVIDPKAAEKLLTTLDDDVLDYAVEQGPDAVTALSRWNVDDLSEHGIELALRAKKDAEVLANVKKLISLGPIDPKHLTQEQEALISAIAANSTQYADEGQVVLGKWVDFGSGFVEVAQDTGSVHYSPHPDMWKLLGGLGEETQGEVAWLINKQVVQTGIDKGLPFEYTLNGIPADNITQESAAIRAIFSGKSDAEIMDILQSEYMPIRMKELQELQKAGYEFTFDNVNKSYIFVKK